MARQPNIKVRLENAEREAREGFAAHMTVRALLADSIVWSGWFCEEGHEDGSAGEYRVGVFGLERCDGGFAVVTFRHPGQGDYTTSYYYDTYEGELRHAYHSGASLIRDLLYHATRRYNSQQAVTRG